jgi:TolB-like protein/tetratricopeptide (TPR) repeat protein
MAEIAQPDGERRPDERSDAEAFEIAGWTVDPSTHRMSLGPQTVRLEPKVMQVLVYLASRQGQTVTRDELAGAVWSGTVVGDDAVTNAVLKLRKAFGDDTGAKVIETIPKRGYRLMAEVRRAPLSPLDTVADEPGARTASPTIAVLPFRNLGGDAEQEYFSDGITEDLTTALSNTGWYQVAASHSAFSYKGRTVDIRQVGSELGVQYVLEGSVRRMGDRLRVAAQLVETGSGRNIWGNRYEGTLADVFDFQDQITESIVGTVEGMFQRAEGERIRHKRPENMEAYDYLLRGLAHMNKLTPEDAKTALRQFRKAIEKDPGYGRAYAYAFWCYRREAQLSGMDLSAEEQAEAVRLMEAGLKADRDDPIVLWQAATLKSYFERDFEGALALIERSLAIDPNSPRAWNASAETHCLMGDSDAAREHAARAIRISPRNPTHWVSYTNIASANLQDRRYEEAADAARKALQLNRYAVLAHLALAASCVMLGRVGEARAAIAQALQLNPRLSVSGLPALFPISRLRNLESYLDALRKAGLPA